MSSFHSRHMSPQNRSDLSLSMSRQHLSTTVEESTEAKFESLSPWKVHERDLPDNNNSTPSRVTRSRSWWRRRPSSSTRRFHSSPAVRYDNAISAWSENPDRLLRLPACISFRQGEKRFYKPNCQDAWDTMSLHSTYSGSTYGFGATNLEI